MKQRVLKRKVLKGSLTLLIVLPAVLLAGCWDRYELNDLAIMVGMGLDKSKDGIRVTSQIVNPSEVASRQIGVGLSPPVSTISATEDTVFEAIRKLSTVSPRRIFASHLRMLVIGEDLARQGIAKIIDGISRNHEFRSDFYLIVARKTSAEKVLEVLTPIEKIPANKMFKTLEMSEKVWAPTVKMKLDKIISDISNHSKDTVLTGIEIVGNADTGKSKKNLDRTDPYAYLKYSGVAIFKQDKLVDWLDEKESKGYNYIMNNVQNTVGHVACPQGGILALEVIRTKSQIIGKVDQGKPQIQIELFSEQNIGEVQCEIDLTKTASLIQLEQRGEAEMEEIMKSAIRKAKKNKADIFGFGESIEDADPRLWEKIKADWDQYFADLQVTVHAEVKIRQLGTINNPLPRGKE